MGVVLLPPAKDRWSETVLVSLSPVSSELHWLAKHTCLKESPVYSDYRQTILVLFPSEACLQALSIRKYRRLYVFVLSKSSMCFPCERLGFQILKGWNEMSSEGQEQNWGCWDSSAPSALHPQGFVSGQSPSNLGSQETGHFIGHEPKQHSGWIKGLNVFTFLGLAMLCNHWGSTLKGEKSSSY